MTRRLLMKRPVFSADKDHIHHRVMSRLRLSHRGTVLALYGLCCFFTAVSLAVAFANGPQSAMLLVALVLTSALLLRKLGYFDRTAAEQMLQMRKRNAELKRTVEVVNATVARASSLDEVLAALHPLVGDMKIAQLSLTFDPLRQRGFNDLTLQGLDGRHLAASRKAMVPVAWQGAPIGMLVADWRDGRAEVQRDEEIGLERIASTIGKVVSKWVVPPVRSMPEPLQVDPVAHSMRAVASGGRARSARA
jgi:UDP-GlcNAc:undecaprenyl-phosphate/decaprenyl-phosphate GlcNAc-1-phosphate transferase